MVSILHLGTSPFMSLRRKIIPTGAVSIVSHIDVIFFPQHLATEIDECLLHVSYTAQTLVN
jgi:hypothetical protein